MTRTKPASNTLAMIVTALLVLYVASYVFIRSQSVWFFYPGSSGPSVKFITFGMTDPAPTFGPAPLPPDLLRRIYLLQAFYAPLRWVDHRFTGAVI